MTLKGGLRFACGYKSSEHLDFNPWILTTQPTKRNTWKIMYLYQSIIVCNRFYNKIKWIVCIKFFSIWNTQVFQKITKLNMNFSFAGCLSTLVWHTVGSYIQAILSTYFKEQGAKRKCIQIPCSGKKTWLIFIYYIFHLYISPVSVFLALKWFDRLTRNCNTGL